MSEAPHHAVPTDRPRTKVNLVAIAFGLALVVLVLGFGRPTVGNAAASFAVLIVMAVLSAAWFCTAVAATRFVKPSPWWVRGNVQITGLLIQFVVVIVAWAAQADTIRFES